MNKKFILIATACFCFFSPFAYGMDVAPTAVPVTTQTDMVKTTDVSTSIRNSFVNDASLAPFAEDVTVRVDDGIVTLSGSAPSEKVKFDFENSAKAAAPVAKVVNNIEVKRGVK